MWATRAMRVQLFRTCLQPVCQYWFTSMMRAFLLFICLSIIVCNQVGGVKGGEFLLGWVGAN